MRYFIEDCDGVIGHPTNKADMIRRWLKSGRASIKLHSEDWMLIKINKKIDSSKTVPVKFIIGLDPGYLHIGFAIFKETDTKVENILVGEAELRTNKVTENMTERKMYRNTRRYHRRKNVKRKFGSCKYRKPVWKNRKKHRFQPTHVHLFEAHTNVLNKILKLVPQDQVKLVVEYVKFDSQKLKNPKIKHFKRQTGPQYGFENVKAYVRHRDNYTCQLCESKDMSIIEAHHIIPRSQHGPDTPENMICLCKPCHTKVQNGRVKCPKQNPNTYIASGVLNSIMKDLYEYLGQHISTSKTYGYVVDAYRKANGFPKSHSIDACIIAFGNEKFIKPIRKVFVTTNVSHMYLKQYRRHVRNWVNQHEDRKYYVGKTCVAWNRRARMEQDKKKPSLEDWRYITDKKGVLIEDNRSIKVTVKPGVTRYRRSNTVILFRPGDSIRIKNKDKTIYDVCQGWASTQGKVIGVSGERYSTKTVVKYKNNTGLAIV